MQLKKVSHVLFDLDGLLIDSETIYAKAYTTVCAKHGKEFTWEMNSTLQGRLGREVAELITKTLDLPLTGVEFSKQCIDLCRDQLENVPLMPDSETIYAKAYTTVCAKHGKEFTWEMNSTLQGRLGREVAELITKTLDLPLTGVEFSKQCIDLCRDQLENVPLMPGARKLLEHLHKHGVPIAMATSSSQEAVNMKMQNRKDLLSLFHHITMGHTDPEVTRGKPDPIIFQVCASRFPDKPKPEDCLVFEDAYNGVLAAKAANMQVVAVPDPHVDAELMKNADATLLLKSLEHFTPELFGLPPYDS